MINTDTQTQGKYKEVWIVKVGRDEFELDNGQMEILKGKIRSGDRGLIEFDDFGFAVSHITSYWLASRQIANQLVAGEKDYTLTPEQRAKGREKVAEIKRSLNRKLELPVAEPQSGS